MGGHASREHLDVFSDAGCIKTCLKPLRRDLFGAVLDDGMAMSKKTTSKIRDKGFVMTEVQTDDDIDDLVLEFVHGRIELAQKLLQSENDVEIKRYGHQVKGTAAILGFPSIAALGKRLEVEEAGPKSMALLSEIEEILMRALRDEGPSAVWPSASSDSKES